MKSTITAFAALNTTLWVANIAMCLYNDAMPAALNAGAALFFFLMYLHSERKTIQE